MGCAPSKGNTIAVQSAQTPRAMPDFRATPPVTPPIHKSKESKEKSNPLDVKRPLPAIGGDSKLKRPGLSTVPEAGEDATPAWMKPDMNAMISDAKSGENHKEVKHTQSSVAFTFSFGDESAPSRAPGRLPPLIREKTIKKETDEKDLKDSLMKRQQEVDNRRQSELDSIAKKKKKRKVKLKKSSSSGVENESLATENEMGGKRDSIVPPLDIPSSSDKNGSLPSAENQNKTSSDQHQTTTLQNGAILSSTNLDDNPQLDPRNGSAHHDSTYGSGDETGVDTQARVIDPLRRFSKRRKGKSGGSKKGGIDADDEFYSGEEDVNPIDATNFFDD